MFIPIERFDEEIFPLAYLIVFTFNEDLKKYEKKQSLKLKKGDFFGVEKKASNSEPSRQSKPDDYKFVKKSVGDICRISGYRLWAFKIINGRILMIISSRINPKTKFNSNNNGVDIQAFSSKILSKIKELGKLEKSYCLWKNQQIDSAIDFVKNETENLEFDLSK